MKDSAKYDANDAPISGAWAGLDPEQQPVIVDAMGQAVKPGITAQDVLWTDAENAALVTALAALCTTHTVQIETGAEKPLHRIVLGDSDFRTSLASAMLMAQAHHAET